MFAYVCPVRTTLLYRVHRLTEDWLNCEQAGYGAVRRGTVSPERDGSVGLLFRATPCGTRCRSGALRYFAAVSCVILFAQQFERRPLGRPVTFTVTPGVVRLRYIPPLVRRSLTSPTDVTRTVAPVTVCLWAAFYTHTHRYHMIVLGLATAQVRRIPLLRADLCCPLIRVFPGLDFVCGRRKGIIHFDSELFNMVLMPWITSNLFVTQTHFTFLLPLLLNHLNPSKHVLFRSVSL